MFKPKNKEELLDIIKEIIVNQNKIINKLIKYPYGLKDDSISSISC